MLHRVLLAEKRSRQIFAAISKPMIEKPAVRLDLCRYKPALAQLAITRVAPLGCDDLAMI